MPDAVNVNKHTKEIKRKKRLNAKKLDREEEHINREEILEAGSDNRLKGIKEIQREQKEVQQEKDKKDADILSHLENQKKFHDSYKKTLAASLGEILEMLDWIPHWEAYCMATNGSPISIKGKPFSTKDGILLIVTTPDGRVFHQGILTTGEPILDYSALYTMAAQVENQMDQERGLLLSKEKEDKEEAIDKVLDQYGKPIRAD